MDDFKSQKVEDSTNAFNYMTWRSKKDVWGMTTHTFQKPYKHKDYEDKVFTVTVSLFGHPEFDSQPKLVLSLYQFENDHCPAIFKANHGWIYDHIWNKDFGFEISILPNSVKCSKPETPLEKRREEHQHLMFCKFIALDIFEIEDLEKEITKGFNKLLQ